MFSHRIKAHSKVLGRYIAHKKAQTKRLSRHTFEMLFLLIGAALVAAVALFFAKTADIALEINIWLISKSEFFAWILLPGGMVIIARLTQRYAPYTSGSGIPQVIACINLPHGTHKTRLVWLQETILKIPLTFLGLICGASIGREGPSVQVGAAVMVAWGRWCRTHNLAFRGMEENNLLAIGAAGGLAAAFNAPLAGVVFAIEELGRDKNLRWERHIMIGVVASGLFLISVEGNYPYFGRIFPQTTLPHMLLWVMICALICGVAGGLFARFLSKGIVGFVPTSLRSWVRKHPLWIAFICGLILAAVGTYYQGQTYGTGYGLVFNALKGTPSDSIDSIALGKWGATVASYWAGIPGGIFTPCLTAGGMIGEWISFLSGVPVDLLVLLCMAAFLAAATQAPLTSAVVTMEMTGTQAAFFWVLVCCITASLTSRQFCPKPFYHFAASRFRQKMIQAQQQQAYDNALAKMETQQDRNTKIFPKMIARFLHNHR